VSTQNEPESATAPAGAAATGDALKFNRITVPHGQFLASAYLAAAKKEKAAANASPHQIGIARMVDELGAISTGAAVHAPPGIHIRNVSAFLGGCLEPLKDCQALAGVFDHAATPRNVLECKHSIAMKRRARDSQSITRRFPADQASLRPPQFHFASSSGLASLQSCFTTGRGALQVEQFNPQTD
jgi:hypothetical protein